MNEVRTLCFTEKDSLEERYINQISFLAREDLIEGDVYDFLDNFSPAVYLVKQDSDFLLRHSGINRVRIECCPITNIIRDINFLGYNGRILSRQVKETIQSYIGKPIVIDDVRSEL